MSEARRHWVMFSDRTAILGMERARGLTGEPRLDVRKGPKANTTLSQRQWIRLIGCWYALGL